jgi:hypothetical protein
MTNRITLCTAALVCSTAHAGTWHVSPAGDDAATGSASAPWKTIQHAADRVQPGDTVVIHAGTYAGFEVQARGTQDAPILFTAEGDARIDGAITSDGDAVHVESSSWIEIRGLTITDAGRTAVSAIQSDHVFVRGNHLDHNAKWGAFSSFCEDFVVEGNEISRSGTQHGVYASNSADHPVIRNNYIWGNAQCGIHMNGDISYGGDGVISGAIVEGNLIRDNGRLGCSGINGDGIQGAVIRNNVLDGNHASGISLYRIDAGAPANDNQVIANTVRMASDARSAINIQNGSTGNIVRNNILIDNAANHGAIDVCASCTTGLSSDHNAIEGALLLDGTALDLATWQARTGNDMASFTTTDAALFEDPEAGDLHLRSGSPAIDRADPTGMPATDFAGTPRPQGAGYDIGAYEYVVAGGGSGSGDGSGSGGPGMGSGTGSDVGTGSAGHHGGCRLADPQSGGAMLVVALSLLSRRRSRPDRA